MFAILNKVERKRISRTSVIARALLYYIMSGIDVEVKVIG